MQIYNLVCFEEKQIKFFLKAKNEMKNCNNYLDGILQKTINNATKNF